MRGVFDQDLGTHRHLAIQRKSMNVTPRGLVAAATPRPAVRRGGHARCALLPGGEAVSAPGSLRSLLPTGQRRCHAPRLLPCREDAVLYCVAKIKRKEEGLSKAVQLWCLGGACTAHFRMVRGLGANLPGIVDGHAGDASRRCLGHPARIDQAGPSSPTSDTQGFGVLKKVLEVVERASEKGGVVLGAGRTLVATCCGAGRGA